MPKKIGGIFVNGKTISPRVELLREFIKETSGNSFQMYRTNEFIKHINNKLEEKVSPKALDEIKNMTMISDYCTNLIKEADLSKFFLIQHLKGNSEKYNEIDFKKYLVEKILDKDEITSDLLNKYIPSANQMNGICDKIGIPSSIFVRLENKLWYDLYKFSKDNNNKFSEKTLIERCQNKLNNTNFTENIIDTIQDINIWNDSLESSEPGNYGIEDFEVYVEDVKIDWDSNSFEADVTFNIDFIMGASRDGFIEPYHQNFLIDGNFIFNKQEGSLSTINVNTQNVCFDLYKSNNN